MDDRHFFFLFFISQEINTLHTHMTRILLFLLTLTSSHPVTCPAPTVVPRGVDLLTYANSQYFTWTPGHGHYYAISIGLLTYNMLSLVNCDSHSDFFGERGVYWVLG
jgi:hypothetical protein